MASYGSVSAGKKIGWRRLERIEDGKQRKLELSGEKKNSQKTISQRVGVNEEIAGKGIERGRLDSM